MDGLDVPSRLLPRSDSTASLTLSSFFSASSSLLALLVRIWENRYIHTASAFSSGFFFSLPPLSPGLSLPATRIGRRRRRPGAARRCLLSLATLPFRVYGMSKAAAGVWRRRRLPSRGGGGRVPTAPPVGGVPSRVLRPGSPFLSLILRATS